jgi:acetyl esterase/lipase
MDEGLMATVHPLATHDAPIVAEMRRVAAAHKGEILGTHARPLFDAMLSATLAPDDVGRERGMMGGVGGWWCRPKHATPGVKLLYLHGGGYMLGSAEALCNLAGQIAARAHAATFLPDYRLAPEHAFPAAIDDTVAVYRALTADGTDRIAVTGDSAGGGLTLSLLSILAAERAQGTLQPVAAAVMSPWTDLGLTANSMASRADADPIFTRDVLVAFASSYLQGHSATDPKASALYASLVGLPPIRIDVGDDEILIDDATRYASRARAAGVDVMLSIWSGMPHVFQSTLGQLHAAQQSLDGIGQFLGSRLHNASSSAT